MCRPGTDRPAPARPAAPAAGVTLIELLVVLAVMAALMGLGVSMFTNMGKQGVFSASVTRVLSTLNRVRNSSMSHPAALQVHAGDPDRDPPEENSVRGVEFVTMWQSQMEPPPRGATDLQGAGDRNGILPPGAVFRQGVIGQALFLEGGGAVDCGNYPVYDATQGIAIDMWVFPAVSGSGCLLRRGDGLVLQTTRQDEGLGVRFDLAFAAGQKGPDGRLDSSVKETRSFDTKGPVLPVGKWSRIVVSYDLTAVTILVDTGRGAVEKLRVPEKAPLAPTTDANLFVGGGQGASFRGGIDDVRLEGVVGEEYEPFASQVRVEPKGKTKEWRIRFDGGKLDKAFHQQPETLVILYGSRRREIVVGLEGNISVKE